MKHVGVLALQGAFAKHAAVLRAVGAIPIEVRIPSDLLQCDALIIPGGESTTIAKQIAFIGLEEPLKQFAKDKPMFGTCAGLILMSREVQGGLVAPFGILDISVARNAYGSQVDSFTTDISVKFPHQPVKSVPAVFIRAPKIVACGGKVEVLATYEGEPVFVQQGHHLGAAFHPELTDTHLIHSYFLSII